MRHCFAALSVLLVFAGCFDATPGTAAVRCASQSECPDGLVCVVERGGCFTSEQVAGRICGDGFIGGAESCDDGDANSDVTPDACRTDCRRPGCGDGVVDRDETCDDGNTADGDGCPADCREVICGDGVTTPPEVCDDRNQRSGDGCRGDCLKIESCGDGVIDDGEGCDDGNDNPADGCDACALVTWQPTLLTGRGLEGGLARTTALREPDGIAIGPDGTVFIADTGQHRVLRVDDDGGVTVVAGTGIAGTSGSGGPAVRAQLTSPGPIAVDGLGRLYVVDDEGKRVQVVDPDGTIRRFAGDRATTPNSGDGGAALQAGFGRIADIVVDGLGVVHLLDLASRVVRSVGADGVIRRTAGGGGFRPVDGDRATSVRFSNPRRLAVTTDGSLVITDPFVSEVFIVREGFVFYLVGLGAAAPVEGALASTVAMQVDAVSTDAAGILLLETGGRLWRVRDGRLRQEGGGGTLDPDDTSDPRAANLGRLFRMAASPGGTVMLLSDETHRAWQIVDGGLASFAGTGAAGSVGEGGPARHARLEGIGRATVDGDTVLLPDAASAAVYRVGPDGLLVRVAGGGARRAPAAALDLRLTIPNAVVADGAGGFYVADVGARVVLHVDEAGSARVVAGLDEPNDRPRGAGDGGLPADVRFTALRTIALDAEGRLLVLDAFECLLWRIDHDGRIRVIAGLGGFNDTGDGGPARQAGFNSLEHLAVAPDGRIVVAGRDLIREIGADGIIRTIGGAGALPIADGVLLSETDNFFLRSLTFDADSRLYVADGGEIHRVDDGRLHLIAGGPLSRPLGDGGPALDADIGVSGDIVAGADGELLVVDQSHDRLRRIGADGIIDTIAGDAVRLDVGTFARAALPLGRVMVPRGDALLVAGGIGRVFEADLVEEQVRVRLGTEDGRAIGTNTPALGIDVFGDVAGAVSDGERLWLAETSRHRLLEVVLAEDVADWRISVIAGATDTAGHADGTGPTARFSSPMGLALDREGGLLVADRGNHVVRRVDLATRAVTTVVGLPRFLGFGGDGDAAHAALLNAPEAVAVGADGALFIADTGNHRVRRVADDVVTTILGDGSPSSAGEGAPAFAFPVESPRAFFVDPHGNLMVTSPTTVRLLGAGDTGVVDGGGPVLTVYGRAPRIGALERSTRCLGGVVQRDGDTTRTFVVDSCAGSLIALDRVVP